VIIIPFEPWHVDHYTPGEIDRIGFDRNQLMAASVNGISIINEDRVIGIGIWFVSNNEATVSFFLSDELRGKPMYLNKGVLATFKWLKSTGVSVINASAASHVDTAKRWLGFLGFEPTGEEKTINGVNIDVYRMET